VLGQGTPEAHNEGALAPPSDLSGQKNLVCQRSQEKVHLGKAPQQ